MKKYIEIKIDLKGIKNKQDFFLKIRETFNLFYNYSKEEYMGLLKKNEAPGNNWDAIFDLLNCLDYDEKGYEIVLLEFDNTYEIKNNFSEKDYNVFLDVMTSLTDNTQRCEEIEFYIRYNKMYIDGVEDSVIDKKSFLSKLFKK